MNPAVTLAFAVVRRLPWKKVPVYWIAQMLGAISASACCFGVYYGEKHMHESFRLLFDIVTDDITVARPLRANSFIVTAKTLLRAKMVSFEPARAHF